MGRILVVDDDPDIRGLLNAYLRADGHFLEFAEDGVSGAELAARFAPDLVLTDFQMPRMDGFALFNALRATPKTQKVPVVMLTAHNSPTLMMKALGMGLDDVIGKPVTREELVKVVSHLLKPAESWRARPSKTTKSLAAARAEFFGSVVCCEIYRLEAFMLKLKKPELVELVEQFAAEVRQAVQEDHGWVLKPDFHRVTLCFTDDPAAQPHALRALRGALKTVLAAQRLKPWIARRFTGRELPEFVVAVGVHSGKVQPRPARTGRDLGVKGEGVEIAELLAEAMQTLRWSVAASEAVFRAVGASFVAGRSAKVQAPDGREIGVIELKGFASQPRTPASPAPERAAVMVEAAVDRNATLATYAAAIPKAAPTPAAAPAKPAVKPAPAPVAKPVAPAQAKPAVKPETQPAAPPPKPAPVVAPAPKPAPVAKPAPTPQVKPAAPVLKPAPAPAATGAIVDPFAGRTVVLRLADTGISTVHLTVPQAGGAQQVVKAFLINDDKKQSKRPSLHKFIGQYAAFRAIDHPNLARTIDHGLSSTHLFVVQEYCSGGDLRNLIAQGMTADDAVKALLRIASGLKAAHAKGFVHADLRPANVMLREDGSFAIVDCSLASVVEYAVAEGDSGVMLRPPDYLSPEMINGQAADTRSDIYVLGLLLHEMLTGKRAYASPDLSKVMMDQLSAPVPVLPPALIRFQPLLARLMAKKPTERFGSVSEVIAFMAGLERPDS